MINIVKTTDVVKGVHKIINTYKTAIAADTNIHRCFADKFDPNIPGGVDQNTEKAWISCLVQEWKRTLRSPSYLPKTLALDHYSYVIRYQLTGGFPRVHRENVLIYKKEVLYIRNMM